MLTNGHVSGYVAPPHDEDAERGIIGATLVSEKAVVYAVTEMQPEEFYSENHRVVFRAIQALASKDVQPDYVTLTDELRTMGELDRIGGKSYIMRLVESAPTGANLKYHCQIVKRAALSRTGIDVSTKFSQHLFDNVKEPEEIIQEFRSEMDNMLRADRTGKVGTLENEVSSLLEEVEDRRHKSGITGIPSGLRLMDKQFGGFQKGRVYIFAARTNVGKTLFLNGVGVHAALQGYTVLEQTPEMWRKDVLERSAAAVSEISLKRIKGGMVTDDELQQFAHAAVKVGKLPLIVDGAGTQTVDRIRRNVIRYNPDLLIIDYLTKITPDSYRVPKFEQITQIMDQISAIAQDYDVPILLGAQLNRNVEGRENPRPKLADLRETGEEQADAVTFLFRESFYNKDAPSDEIQFICDKDRHGETWESTMYIRPNVMKIYDRREW